MTNEKKITKENYENLSEYMREIADCLFDYKSRFNQMQITDDLLFRIDAIADEIEKLREAL